MNWYRNRKTVTKLMIAFAFMAALMGVVGYQGLTAASTLNGVVDDLYTKQMLGAVAAHQMEGLAATIGRDAREALLTKDAAAREKCARDVTAAFSALDEAFAATEKTLASEEGKAALAKVRPLEAEYKPMVVEALGLAINRQDKEAIEHMAKAKQAAELLMDACKNFGAVKDRLGKNAMEQSAITYTSIRTNLLVFLGIAVVVAIGLGWFLANLMASPLRQMVAVAVELAEGHLDQLVDHKSADETGQLAEAFRSMIAGFSAPVKEAAAVLGRVAGNDLTARMQGECKGDFAAIKTSVNAAVEKLASALTEVQQSAAQVSSTSQQLSSASEELASGAQEQASSQEETSSSLVEISATIKQNAENAQQARQLAENSREAAEKGGTVVREAVVAMGEINSSSKRIADIISTIDEIAFQTNLLALNAAVEAARAGEQGRGFAVVASEVRNLAQRSATAAKEIKGLIQDSVRKVETGSDLVNRSGQTLNEIVNSVKRVTDIVAEIAAASHEQATGIEQVSKAMTQMDQVTQTNSGQTEELSSTAEELSSTAEQLQGLTAQFELGATHSAPARHTKSKLAVRRKASSGSGLKQLAQATAHEPEDSFAEF
jgi:methyl-accepting chemotaxis protein